MSYSKSIWQIVADILILKIEKKYPAFVFPMGKNKNIISELWSFMKQNKAWWLTPIIIMLILVGVLIFLGQSSAVSPFVYALF